MQVKAEMCSLLSAGIAGSNHGEGMDVLLFYLFVVYLAASATS
jgi:hypothetical protein